MESGLLFGAIKLEIKQYTWDKIDSNSWLILENKHGLLIDAVENEELYKAIKPLESLTIILTHCHFDHIIGLNQIRRIKPETEVIATKLCSEYIGNKFRNMSASATAFMCFYKGEKKNNGPITPFICGSAEMTFENEMIIRWQRHNIKLTAVHGHSQDSLVLQFDEDILFTGDTLLRNTTVTRLPGGNTRRFWEEDIPLLRAMKAQKVYPGHGTSGKLSKMLEKTGKETYMIT